MLDIEDFDLAKYKPIPVTYELRQSILEGIKNNEEIISDIDGREETKKDVIRAILSGANPYLVSEEGTGKTRLSRSLTRLLSPVPVIKGCPYHDDPKWSKDQLCPRCAESYDPVEEYGIGFISGDERFSRIQGNEYTNYARILGLKDIEAIREGRSPTDPRAFTGTGVFHANRGILFIDELPSIPTNIQVLLHTILEEKRVVLEEYNLEQPVDLILIATGNPEGFSHVNRIPPSVLDSLELIHMGLPEEDFEKTIMLKESFRVGLKRHYKALKAQSDKKNILKAKPKVLDRSVAIPWWSDHIIAKTIDYTRYCPNLDRGTSIWGAKKAIDHTYASVEMRCGSVANLEDVCNGLKLSLRGRIKIRSDFVDFGENPGDSFRKTDGVIEDIMRHAVRGVGNYIYENMEYGRGLSQGINDYILRGKFNSLGEIKDIKDAIDWIYGVAPKKVEKDLLNDSELKLFYDPDNLKGKAKKEYYYSTLEILINTGAYKGIIDENAAKKYVFIPEVF